MTALHRSAAVLIAVSWLVPCQAVAANAAVADAERRLEQLDFRGARAALEQARGQRGNSRAELLRILELEGIVLGSLDDAEGARHAFRALLNLEPAFVLPVGLSPKVTVPFEDVRAEQIPALRVDATVTRIAGAAVAVRVVVENDVLGLAQAARVQFAVGDEERSTLLAPLVGRTAEVVLRPDAEPLLLQVIGEREAILAEQKLPAPPPPLTPQPRAADVPGARALRPWMWTAGGAAVLTIGAGTVFGLRAGAARDAFEDAARDEAGRVIGLTQREAFELEARSRREGAVANLLWATGGVLAATAVTLYFLDGRVSAEVTPSAVTLGGVWE